MKRKNLFKVLFIIFAFVFTTYNLNAAEIEINSDSNLKTTLENAEENDVLKLTSDLTLSSRLSISKSLTLDLNGFEIKSVDNYSDAYGLIYVGLKGKLIVTDTSTGKTGKITSNSEIAIGNYGELTIDAGHITGLPAIYNFHYDSLEKASKTTINGGKITSAEPQEEGTIYNCGELIINGGTIEGMLQTSAKLSINGGNIETLYFHKPDYKPLVDTTTTLSGNYTINEIMADAFINDTLYVTLNDAIEAAKDGDLIQLVQDVKLTKTISFNKNLTIDLNGHDITYNPSKVAFNFSDKTGNTNYKVEFKNSKDKLATITGEIDIIAKGNTYEVTIGKNVKVYADNPLYFNGNGTKDSAVFNIYGTLKATDNTGYAAIQGNGNPNNGGTTINIYEGAVIENKDDAAIYQPQIGDINIYGGEITANEVIAMKVGTLNVYGGTLKSTGSLVNPALGNNNGSENTGAVISLTSNKGYPGDIEVNITGGKFIAEKSYALFEGISLDKNGNPVVDKTNVTKLNVTGGEFVGGTDADRAVYIQNENDISDLKLTGGTYNKAVDAAYLSNAIDRANDGDTIKLFTDILIDKTFGFTKNLAIDLNGHKIDSKVAYMIDLLDTSANKQTVSFINTAEKEAEMNGQLSIVPKSPDKSYEVTIGKNVKITAKYAVYVQGNDVDNAIILNVYGKLIAKEDTNGSALSGNGSKGYGGTVINVFDGAIIRGHEHANAIYQPQRGVINIYGGELTGYHAISMKVGTLNVYGGTLKSTGTLVNPALGNNNGSENTGAVISLTSNKSYPGDIKVNITGGKFIAEKSYALFEGISLDKDGNPVIDKTNVTKLNITGGEFVGGTDADRAVYIQNENDISDLKLTGGTYNKAVDAAYLSNAIDRANDGDTIKLFADIKLDETISFNKNLTIDLNGHDITYNPSKVAFNFSDKTGNTNYKVEFKNSKEKLATITGEIDIIAKGNTYEVTIGKNVKVYADNPLYFNGNGTKDSAVFNIYGTLKATDNTGYAAIQGNGNPNNGGTTINIYEGAVIENKDDAAIYQPQIGDINIYGGEITANEVIAMKVGTLNVYGGRFKSTGSLVNPALGNNNGSENTGAVISLTSNKGYPGDIKVNITGGKFIAEKSYALFEGISLDKNGNPVADNTNVTAINITGGYFKGGSESDVDLYIQNENDIDLSLQNAKFAKGFELYNTGLSILGENTDDDNEEYPYTIVQGKIIEDIVWNKTISNDLNIETNLKRSYLNKVEIDAVEINASSDFYTKDNGENIVITIFNTTLEKLSVGKHTLTLTINGEKYNKDFVIYEDLTLNDTTLSIDKMILGSPISEINVTDTVKNGLKPYSFTAFGLPEGLTIDSKTGIISGTPTEETTAGIITVLVKDGRNVATIVNIPYVKTSKLAKTTVTVKPVSYNTIDLAWEEIEGATEYYVYRKTSSASKYTMIANTKDLTYSDDSVKTGTTYNYIIRALNDVTYTNSDKTTIKAIPGTTTEVKVTEGYNNVTLKWNKVDGATGYYIYRATKENGTYTKIGSTTKLTYKNSSLTTNKTYYYKVAAYKTVSKKAVLGKGSDAISATPHLNSTTATGHNNYYEYARITWTKVDGATAYRVYRSNTVDGKYEYIGYTKNTYYNDSKVEDDTTYFYKVRPYRTVSGTKKYADYSNIVEASTPNSDITLTVNSVNYNKLELSMNKVEGAVKYKIYRATSKTGKYTLIKELLATDFENKDMVTYTDTTTTGKTYYYKVRVGNKNHSNYSSIKSAKALPNVPVFEISNNGVVEIEKVDGASGYTIYISKTGKAGSFNTITSTTKLTYDLSEKLYADTTFIAVKSYRTVNGKKVYSTSYEVVEFNKTVE